MDTPYVSRVTLIVPVARIAAFNQWAKDNLAVGPGNWLTLGVPTRTPTHAQASFCVNLDGLRKLVRMLYTMGAFAVPPDLDTSSETTLRTLFLGRKATLKTRTGVMCNILGMGANFTVPFNTDKTGASLAEPVL